MKSIKEIVAEMERKTVRIGKVAIYVDGNSNIGTYCKIMAHIWGLVDRDCWRLPMAEGTPYEVQGMQRYRYNLQERVARRIWDKLHEIKRAKDKARHSRYQHWSHTDGRFVDDGE